MLFNSFVFPIFFLIVWAVYLCLKQRPQNLLLLAASYVFYGWWDYRFMALLAFSTVQDYLCGILMDNKKMSNWIGETRWRRSVLLLSIVSNLTILGFFKYFNFFVNSVERVLAPLGLQPDFVTLNILLPIGISFYTFQTMSYTIDVYRKNSKPCRNFIDFALYVAYFPSLVAGPIERATNLLPQIQKRRILNNAMFYSACQLILMGYFKKVFVADGVAPIVAECFNTPDKFGGITLFLGAVLFTIQIYGDFSGYTDIARGVGRLFGFEMILNFRQPFFSKTTTEFWQRWHISLSSWIREYLYEPLMYWMMDHSRWRMPCLYASLMISMLLCGLWHGASMKFIVFGGLQGIFLCMDAVLFQSKYWKKILNITAALRIQALSGIVITVTLFTLCGVFFRAASCSAAVHYFSKMCHAGTSGMGTVGIYVAFYGLCIFIVDLLCVMQKSEVPFTNRVWFPVRALGYACMLFLLLFIGENDVQPFIYFQF